MERNVQRIDGVVTHLHQLSHDELETERAHAAMRMHNAMLDIDHLEQEIARRRPIGELALQHAAVLEVTAVPQLSAFETSRVDL